MKDKTRSCIKYNYVKHIKLLFLVVLICFVNAELLCAQNQNAKSSHDVKDESSRKESIPFRNRWGFRTNAFDWLLLAPNVGIEFDLSNSIYNNSVLLFNVKGNWRTAQSYKSPLLYNFWDLRAEYRYYWRTKMRQQNDTMSFKDKLFSRSRKKARTWRAYYMGGYVNANRYTVKLGKKGLQGTSYGVGVSAGFGIPLYRFKHGFLDFELGGNIGFAMAEYDKFTYDRAGDCYPVEESKPLHFVPFPIIHDIQATFVYRFGSVKDKYGKANEKKIEARQAREAEKREQERINDSINVARKLEKEAMKALKEQEKDNKKQLEKQKKVTEEYGKDVKTQRTKGKNKKEKEKVVSVEQKKPKGKKSRKNDSTKESETKLEK